MRLKLTLVTLFAILFAAQAWGVDCKMAREQAKGQPKLTKAEGIAKAMSFGISRAVAEEYSRCFETPRHKRKAKR